MASKTKQAIKDFIAREKDPNLWPVRDRFDVYMVDCEVCHVRMHPAGMDRHRLKHVDAR